MKRQRVLVASFIIGNPKQVKLFQLRLPRISENVIGIETGMRWLEGNFPATIISPVWKLPIEVKRNIVLGDLKIQSSGMENIFYATDLLVNQNFGQADFTTAFWPAKENSHKCNSFEEVVKINCESTILQAMYTDKFWEQQTIPYKYRVSVYVWVECKAN